jgi:tetratricopeptide (TPR) repeat protein
MKTRTMLYGPLLLLLSFAIAVPARAQTANPQDTLNHYVSDLQESPDDTALRAKLIAFVQTMKPAPAISEEAKRHMNRGLAAAEGAKDDRDLKDAIGEFQRAVNSAPWLGVAYRNLAVMQDRAGQYSQAMQNLKFYLLTEPSTADAEAAKALMEKIEYRKDKEAAKAAATSALFEAFGFTGRPGPVELRRGRVSEYEVRAAIERGADVNDRRIAGNTALVEAALCCQANIVQLLLENGAVARDGEALIAAVDSCEGADVVKLLIDKGADVNAKRSSDGETALMWSAQMAEVDVVRLLLKNGADVHAKDSGGRTALRRLVEDGGNGFWNDNRKAQFERDKPEVVRLLKEAGAKE